MKQKLSQDAISILSKNYTQKHNDNLMLFKSRLAALIKYRNISQKDFGRIWGNRKQNTISAYLSQKENVVPNFPDVTAICSVLNFNPAFLYDINMTLEQGDLLTVPTHSLESKLTPTAPLETKLIPTSIVKNLTKIIEESEYSKTYFIMKIRYNGVTYTLQNYAEKTQGVYLVNTEKTLSAIQNTLKNRKDNERLKLIFDDSHRLSQEFIEEVISYLCSPHYTLIFIGTNDENLPQGKIDNTDYLGMITHRDKELIVDSVFPQASPYEKKELVSYLNGGFNDFKNMLKYYDSI